MKSKLSKAEILAFKSAVKAGLRMRQHPAFPWFFMRGYWTGLQAMAYNLPPARKTARLIAIYDRAARRLAEGGKSARPALKPIQKQPSTPKVSQTAPPRRPRV